MFLTSAPFFQILLASVISQSCTASTYSPRNFTPELVGYFFAEVLFIKGIGVILGIPLMSKILKWSDLTIAIVGSVISIGQYIFLGFASNKWMMFVGGLIAIGAGITPPCMRSMISKQVEPSEQGTTFALVASLEVLETLLASLIFNSIYSATVDWLPGFCYFLMSGMTVFPIILLIWLYVLERQGNPYAVMQSPDVEGFSNGEEAFARSSIQSEYGSSKDAKDVI